MNSSIISHNHCSGSSNCTGPSESEYMSRARERSALQLTKEIVEEFTAVFVRVEAVIDIGLQPGVNVAVVELSVEDQENRI
jgi:hypothetical protein